MNRLSARLGTALLVLLAAAVSQIRADYLNWTYTSATSTPTASVGNQSSGFDTVALKGLANPNQAGAASIPVIGYFTSAGSSGEPSFGSGQSYNLALTITDNATHDSATLNFTGYLSGSFTQTASTLHATFGSPLSLNENGVTTPNSSNSFTLDGHTYTVNIAPVTLLPPTNPAGALNPQTNIMASVSVSDGSQSGPPPATTPEPASLILGSLGFSCLGIGCWWKRRFQLRRRPQQSDQAAA